MQPPYSHHSQTQVPTPQPWLTLTSDFCVCCSTPINTELKRKPSKQSTNLGSLAHHSPWWLTPGCGLLLPHSPLEKRITLITEETEKENEMKSCSDMESSPLSRASLMHKLAHNPGQRFQPHTFVPTSCIFSYLCPL